MKVASAYRSEGVSLDQMLVSLYKANPQAFVGQNMNRLKAGQILSIPDSDAVQASAGNASGAHSVVLAHAADFNAYRNKLADHVDRAPAEKGQAAKQTASGTITAKVKETPSATSESADKLKLSKSANAATKTSDGKGLSEEDKLAKNKAAAEAAGRLKELEKNVSDLQRLLDVKNKDLAAKELELNAKAKAEQKSAPASATVAAVGKTEVASNAVSSPERADVASAPASVVDASPRARLLRRTSLPDVSLLHLRHLRQNRASLKAFLISCFQVALWPWRFLLVLVCGLTIKEKGTTV
jgi:pilus assembly protein FimV